MSQPLSLSSAPPCGCPTELEALRHCQEVTRHHSQTFYLGSRFFAPQERRAVWAVYAACRAGDDVADNTQGSARQKADELARWRHSVEAAFAGEPLPTPVSLALAWAAQRYPIPQAPFEELHEGLQMDLDMDRCAGGFQTMDDLQLYCRRVAGVVGFMIAPISGYGGGEPTLDRALKLGQAMQLTNILRDVGEDLRRGRVYLPADQMDQFGVNRADLERSLRGETLTPGYRALMRHLSDVARAGYAQSYPGIAQLRGRARFAVAAAAAAYEGILDDLERAGFNNFGRRAHVSSARKALLLPPAFARVLLSPVP